MNTTMAIFLALGGLFIVCGMARYWLEDRRDKREEREDQLRRERQRLRNDD